MRHRSHSIEFKRQVVQEYLGGETLHGLAKQLHADLVALGYDGSYNRVAAFARAWKAERQRDA